MKKIAAITTSALLALSLVACGTTPQAESEPETEAIEETTEETAEAGYIYEGVEVWDVEQEAMCGSTLRDIMTTMAKPETDMDAYIASPLGEYVLKTQALMGYDISSDELASYWANLGMTHEAHDVDDADHWPTPSIGTQVVDFLEQFSK